MRTDYATMAQRTTTYAQSQFLEHAQPQAACTKFGATKPMPKNKAEKMTFRRAVPFPRLVTPLAEGVTPAARTLQFEDVEVTMQEWGDVVEISDRVRELSEDPAIQIASKLLGEQAIETQEAVCFGVIKAGSQVVYANGSARNAVNTAISINKIHSALRTLYANRAMRITEIQAASVNYETRAIEGGFIAFGHTDLEHDIRALTNFVPVARYGQRKPVSQYELGAVENVRFVLTPNFEPFLASGSGTLNGMKSVGAANVDVYPVIIIARDAYAHVPLKGSKSVEMFVHDTADKNDPMNQRDIAAAKYWYNCVRLNEGWMIRIECGATSL